MSDVEIGGEEFAGNRRCRFGASGEQRGRCPEQGGEEFSAMKHTFELPRFRSSARIRLGTCHGSVVAAPFLLIVANQDLVVQPIEVRFDPPHVEREFEHRSQVFVIQEAKRAVDLGQFRRRL